jgi:hypothetical protein
MALIKKGLVHFGPGVAAGYAYDSETLEIKRFGGINPGLGILWVQVTSIPTGRIYEHTFAPGEEFISPDITSHGLLVTRQDWEEDGHPFSTEASYVGG